MAYTYTSSVNSKGNPAIQFRMGYEIASQNTGAAPSSVVNVVLQTRRTNTSTTNKQPASTSMTIDTTSYTQATNYNVSGYTQNTWYTIMEKTGITVLHDPATGEKTLPLAFSINLSGTSASSASGEWSVALTPIAMGSTLALNASSYTISDANGPTATATITRYNTSYYHQLVWKLGSTTIATQNAGKVASATRALTASAWLTQMTTSASEEGSCTLKTYSDSGYSNQVGVDSTVSFTVVCTRNPSIGTVTVATSGGISNVWVGGYSAAKVTAATVAGINGSTITKYEFLVNNAVAATYSSSAATYNWTSGVLNAGTYTFAVRVTDSRGRTATKSATAVTVSAYASPKITGISIFRCNSGGTAQEDGKSISVKATATATPAGNSITTFKVYTKAPTASTWTDKGALTNNTAKIISTYAATSSWNVKIEAIDALGVTSTYSATISTASYTMDFKVGGLGIGIGKVAEENNLLDSAWAIKSATNIEADGYFRGKDTNTGYVGKIILVPRYAYSTLGLSSGNNLAFWSAWIKKMVELYPSVSQGLFEGLASPADDGIVIWYCANTSQLSSGLPQYSSGVYIPYNGNGSATYFGTSAYTAWIATGTVVTSGTQTFSGRKTFASGSGVCDASSPIWYFFRTNGGKLGNIFALGKTVNSKTVMDRMYFREYSYDSTTGDPIELWDNYRLPSVAANKTTVNNYEILTSKSAVTIAQGGTGQGAPSTVTTGVVSSVSGATLSVQNARKWGKVCDLYLEFNAGTVAGNGNITATVASGYIPALAASGCGYWSQSPFIAQLDSNGNLNIRNASGTSRTFSTTSPLRIALSYQIA